MTSDALAVIDVAPLVGDGTAWERAEVAAQIRAACREYGFFYVTGHGIPAELLEDLAEASAEFFALAEADKRQIAMARGGRAWRGWFPVGGELTSGRPDQKEGLYFGTELPPDDPRVVAGLPLHGANLFPQQVPRLGPLVLEYLEAATKAGQAVLSGLAISLGLDARYFADSYTADPTVLFRVFHYPAVPAGDDRWGVGEHTDYGLLTLLAQDDSGGLQVAAPGGAGWIDAPPLPGTLVCNIGDMLDRLTGGWYRSTPHRVRNTSGHSRLSFAFFLDPGFGDEVPPLPARAFAEGSPRWDGQDLRAFTGTYGDYLLGKVAKVFPQLREEVL